MPTDFTTPANASSAYKAQIKTIASNAGTVIHPSGNVITDTAALKAAFLAGGKVELGSGVFLVDTTPALVTTRGVLHITCNADTIVRQQASGTGNNLLTTAAVLTAAATVTLFTSAGNVGTVVISAHGYIAGQYIFIHSSDTDGYNGVYEVQTVVDSNTLTVRLPYVPLASTAVGTILAKPGTEEIIIDGGIWDYDRVNNGSTGFLDTNMIIMAGVHKLTFKNMQPKFTEKFAL